MRILSVVFFLLSISGNIYAQSDSILVSKLETYNIETAKRTLIYRTQGRIEAPNWSTDGSYFLFNSEGKLYTLAVSGGKPKELDTGFADHINNDHGFSKDGKKLAISHAPDKEGSKIYVLPAEGGKPQLVTSKAPSYWHGWSPSGDTLVYPGRRNGEFDIYAIPVNGGTEKKLTDAPGLDDGAEYTPNGKWIYFNSVRTGVMKIFRMRPNGSQVEQITSNKQYGDWFPHISPDSKHIVFLSYDASVEGHPPYKNVALRLMPLEGGQPKVVVRLFGGQGTINVPSWAPDSKRFAFVSYEFIKQ